MMSDDQEDLILTSMGEDLTSPDFIFRESKDMSIWELIVHRDSRTTKLETIQ